MPPSGPDRRETEIKLALPSAEAGRALLARAGFAASHPRAFEANSVYDTPAGGLMRSSRLLRLRDFRGQAILTFKGPPEPGPHKSRPEIETSVQDPAALHLILSALGYQVQFRYEKFRTTFHHPQQPGHALLDETPIGVFLELEGPPDWIDSTAAALGFAPAAYILLSYGALYRLHCQNAGIPPAHMVFPQ
ncbi:MAG: class IV adenylate cyclase [Candidatus Solibacter usitatus]|nr:class IV adenylate cyclase [Candidatus Solibacter usitatus]